MKNIVKRKEMNLETISHLLNVKESTVKHFLIKGEIIGTRIRLVFPCSNEKNYCLIGRSLGNTLYYFVNWNSKSNELFNLRNVQEYSLDFFVESPLTVIRLYDESKTNAIAYMSDQISVEQIQSYNDFKKNLINC